MTNDLQVDGLWYPFFCDSLKKRHPFAFSRWGDGEFACLLKRAGHNCDGHDYFPLLGDKLGDILMARPEYFIGMQPKAMRDMGDEINDWLMDNRCDDLAWIGADVFHNESQIERLSLFFDAVRDREVRAVGPYWMRFMPTDLMQFDLEPVNEKNCWTQHDDVLDRIEERFVANTVILFCCGMMSNVLIDELYKRHGDDVTLVDMGSVLSPYCGVNNRRYMEKMKCE